jgi:FixJ family two-component response regulator
VSKKPLISVVDDDASFRAAIKGLMRSLGYAAETFATASDFIVSRHRKRTSCLIVDVNMPGMSGPDLHQHLIDEGEAIPTILVTAYPNDVVRTRALSAGVIAYLKKPFDEAELLGFVNSALADKRLPRSSGQQR